MAGAEEAGRLPYQPMAPSEWVARTATAALRRLPEADTARIRVVSRFREALPELAGVTVPDGVLRGDPSPLLRFPLLLPNTAEAERLISGMRAIGVFAERWGRPLLYPGVDDEAAFCAPATPDSLPVTRDVSARVVALPTELDDAHAADAVRLVQKWSRHRA
ncbi:hypothetical protein [Actinomyces ruminis]|uniref:hypothetical protein n=1 Tax=Actinomyces ruminis TaxID=1937003 RepID=UPI00211E3D82|nr:hypothetical protein [Actinomyces ruminis]